MTPANQTQVENGDWGIIRSEEHGVLLVQVTKARHTIGHDATVLHVFERGNQWLANNDEILAPHREFTPLQNVMLYATGRGEGRLRARVRVESPPDLIYWPDPAVLVNIEEVLDRGEKVSGWVRKGTQLVVSAAELHSLA